MDYLVISNYFFLLHEISIYLLLCFYPNLDSSTTASHSAEDTLGVVAPDIGLVCTDFSLNFHCEQQQSFTKTTVGGRTEWNWQASIMIETINMVSSLSYNKSYLSKEDDRRLLNIYCPLRWKVIFLNLIFLTVYMTVIMILTTTCTSVCLAL